MDRIRFSSAKPPRRRSPRGLAGLDRQTLVNAVALCFGALLLAYLEYGHLFILAGLLAFAGLGVDQVLRAHPRSPFDRPFDTITYLFVPLLFALGSALFLRDVEFGFVLNVLVCVFAAGLFAFCTHAEYLTVEAAADTYPVARFALSLVSYLAAFSLFTVVLTSGLRLPLAILIVAAVAMLLTVDLLRELDVSLASVFLFGAGVAVVVGEVGWAVYFLALPDLLTGGLLLLTFYVLTGLIQGYLSGHFDRRTVTEFAGVGAFGLAIIAGFTIMTRVS